ncbi:DDB1- and CUL4-associated factor 11-like [Gigantopelta aegis]|uniref:DDB1- and CUL4-associated factor 11-like n=1 Tax=Gigantopelta aegis TaxID=1735272 RepID=UPI001B88B02C|nr:DDB1- and CUL4-associated factor 11-like [Gigantopelta aegis]
MGSNHSRRRRMSSNENHDGSDSSNRDDDGDQDLPSILAYLIRSGQIRIFSSDDPPDDDDSDAEFCGPSRPPLVDPNPDTSNITENDISQLVMIQSGRSPKSSRLNIPTITHMINQREIGFNKQQHFTHGDRCLINSKFLPNRMTKMASYHQKAFCGTYSLQGDIFLTASQDQYIRIYDTTNEQFRLFKVIRARDVGWSVLDTAFSPDGNFLIYSSWSDCIHLCNIYGEHDIHEALHLLPGEHSFCIFSLMFSSDNQEIMGGANDRCLYVFDRESNQRTLRIECHDDDVNAVSFADDSSQILFSGGDDGLVKVWDRRTLQESNPVPVGVMAGHHDGVTFIDSKRDARYLVSNSKDQTIKLWDVRVFSTKDAVEATKKAVSNQRWDYRWQQVPRKMSRKSKMSGDTSVMTYKGHCVLHTLVRCRFSPQFTTGQRYIYSGCATGCVVIYDLLSGKIVKKLEGHQACVRDVSWHPFDNSLMSTSWDGTIGRWDYEELQMSDNVEMCCGGDLEDDPKTQLRRSSRLKRRMSAGRNLRGLFD